MNYDQISNFSQKETISFLQSKGLIPSEKRCSNALIFYLFLFEVKLLMDLLGGA